MHCLRHFKHLLTDREATFQTRGKRILIFYLILMLLLLHAHCKKKVYLGFKEKCVNIFYFILDKDALKYTLFLQGITKHRGDLISF